MSYSTFADREIMALVRLGLYRSQEEVIFFCHSICR